MALVCMRHIALPSLQCFDTVGWATEGHLVELSVGLLVMTV